MSYEYLGELNGYHLFRDTRTSEVIAKSEYELEGTFVFTDCELCVGVWYHSKED